MNWEAVQAIAELCAALAVLASLAYLAVQIRQNTASVQSSTVARSSEILNRIRNHLWVDPEAMRIYLLALSGEEIEDGIDSVRARMFLVALARDYEAMFHQYVSGELPEGMWEGWRQEMLLVFTTPGGQDAMEAMAGTLLSQSFTAYLRSEVARTDGSPMQELRARWVDIGQARRKRDAGSEHVRASKA